MAKVKGKGVKGVRKGWKRYKIVEVEWEDCLTSGDWDDSWRRKVEKWRKQPPHVAYTYGVLLHQDASQIIVAETAAITRDGSFPEHTSMNDLTYIPAAMKRKVTTLGYRDFPLDIDGEEG